MTLTKIDVAALIIVGIALVIQDAYADSGENNSHPLLIKTGENYEQVQAR